MDWTEIAIAAIGAAASLLTVVVTATIPWLAATLKRKWGVEIDEAQRQRLERMAHDAIAYAEEQARKAATSKSTPLSGAEKLTVAKRYMKKNCGVACDDEQMQHVIEAKMESSTKRLKEMR
jgi:hypothetical protein